MNSQAAGARGPPVPLDRAADDEEHDDREHDVPIAPSGSRRKILISSQVSCQVRA